MSCASTGIRCAPNSGDCWKRRRREETSEGTVYRVYYCTIYYTPRESGFTAERGFDDTRVSAPGLKGRKYPLAFLQAVKREGFGRLSEPVRRPGLPAVCRRRPLPVCQGAAGQPRQRARSAEFLRHFEEQSVSSSRSGFAHRFANGPRGHRTAANGSLTTQAEAFTRSRSTYTGVKTIPSVRSAACARVRQALEWNMLST